MDDLISRAAAIDAVGSMLRRKFGIGGDLAEITLAGLPSAQQERTEERTETHACDCISRQAAIDAHYEYCNKHPDAGFPVWSLKILEDLPSAQPQPQRTGRWIPQKGGGLCCSECGGYALDEPDGNFIHVAVPSKFCPNCGAMMEGEG